MDSISESEEKEAHQINGLDYAVNNGFVRDMDSTSNHKHLIMA